MNPLAVWSAIKAGFVWVVLAVLIAGVGVQTLRLSDSVADLANENKDFLKVLGFEQGVIELWDDLTKEKRTDRIQKKLAELGFVEYGYANYVLALTMGAGKTILMGVLMMSLYEGNVFSPKYSHIKLPPIANGMDCQ